MKHTIQYPIGPWEDEQELRTIVWDDEAGTVEGDHPSVPKLKWACESDEPYVIIRVWGMLDLDDVAHNPQHFLSALNDPFERGEVQMIPAVAVLPDILKGIEPLLPEFVPPPPGSYY